MLYTQLIPPFKTMTDIWSGNLEHLHLYCQNTSLLKACAFCHGKKMSKPYRSYTTLLLSEKNLPFAENKRTSILQKRIEQIASDLQKQEHLIFKKDQLVMEARTANKAILSRNALQCAIATHHVPAEKLLAFDQFPLSFRLVFIHSLPEHDFDIGSVRISDVGYAGFFPKAILQELHGYVWEIRNPNDDDTEFFMCRPIAVQKVIHILLADTKAQLHQLEKETNATNISARLKYRCYNPSYIATSISANQHTTLMLRHKIPSCR